MTGSGEIFVVRVNSLSFFKIRNKIWREFNFLHKILLIKQSWLRIKKKYQNGFMPSRMAYLKRISICWGKASLVQMMVILVQLFFMP